MYGVSLLRQADLAGAQRDRSPASALWRTRSFVAGPGVRHCLTRASGTGACAVSWGPLRDEHPDLLPTTREKPRAAELEKLQMFQKHRWEQAEGAPDP
jgi:hypothetical protein